MTAAVGGLKHREKYK